MPATNHTEFEKFVKERERDLYRVAASLWGPVDAADAVQDVLVALLKRGVADCADPYTYALAVLFNGRRKAKHRATSRARRHPLLMERPPAASTDQVVDGDEIRRALAQLPPRMRQAVVLRHMEDFSVEETAEIMGCSTGTVKSLSHKGRGRLGEILGASAGGLRSEGQRL